MTLMKLSFLNNVFIMIDIGTLSNTGVKRELELNAWSCFQHGLLIALRITCDSLDGTICRYIAAE